MEAITATIITKNEQENIERCLISLQGVADEIIVIDSFSTDKTVEICEKYNCIVRQRRFAGFGVQKQYAVSLATNSYILSIDADETLDSDLREAIIKLKINGLEKHHIYSFSVLNLYCGIPIKHCGWFPDTQVRLFDKRYAGWNLRDVKESVVYPKSLRVNLIDGYLFHYRCATPEEYVSKMNKIAQIDASILRADNNHGNIFKPRIMWLKTFIKYYIIKKGMIDGKAGREISIANANAEYLKYQQARKRDIME
ncbi:MAG: glycosyltransferase family 2 protein [Bacteroidales bacterium]